MAKKRKKAPIKVYKTNSPCPFCTKKFIPDYKDYKTLFSFISDRARIYSRDRSGVCSKHQRGLSTAIKQARILGLLPFTPSV